MVGGFPRPHPNLKPRKTTADVAPTPSPTVAVDSIEYDEDGRRIITAPLAPASRPPPTIAPAVPYSRQRPLPPLPLSMRNVAPVRPPARPGFTPPPRRPISVEAQKKQQPITPDDIPFD